MEIFNVLVNIVFLLITFGFMCLYLVSLIMNIVRAAKVLKDVKKDPKKVQAKVVEITEDKRGVYVKYKYTSPTNNQHFTDMLILNKKDFKDQYYVDQDIEVVYPEVKDYKRVYYFPKFINDQKVRIEAGPLFTDILLAVAGISIFGYSLFVMVNTPGAFTGEVPLVAGGFFSSPNADGTEIKGVFNMFSLLAMLVIYFMLFSYVLERLVSASVEHTHSYLKLCGIMCTAKVVTYKFGRTKDANGNKEAQMKIEFYDNGELIQANLNSHLYSETQEEYIKILYDPKHPKTTVYMR